MAREKGEWTPDLVYVRIWYRSGPALENDLCESHSLSKENKILSEKDECRQIERMHKRK